MRINVYSTAQKEQQRDMKKLFSTHPPKNKWQTPSHEPNEQKQANINPEHVNLHLASLASG